MAAWAGSGGQNFHYWRSKLGSILREVLEAQGSTDCGFSLGKTTFCVAVEAQDPSQNGGQEELQWKVSAVEGKSQLQCALGIKYLASGVRCPEPKIIPLFVA